MHRLDGDRLECPGKASEVHQPVHTQGMVGDKDDSFLNVATGVFHCQNIPSVALASHDHHRDDDHDHPGDHQHIFGDHQFPFSQSQSLFHQFQSLFHQFDHFHCPESHSLFSQSVFLTSAQDQE